MQFLGNFGSSISEVKLIKLNDEGFEWEEFLVMEYLK